MRRLAQEQPEEAVGCGQNCSTILWKDTGCQCLVQSATLPAPLGPIVHQGHKPPISNARILGVNTGYAHRDGEPTYSSTITEVGRSE